MAKSNILSLLDAKNKGKKGNKLHNFLNAYYKNDRIDISKNQGWTGLYRYAIDFIWNEKMDEFFENHSAEYNTFIKKEEFPSRSIGRTGKTPQEVKRNYVIGSGFKGGSQTGADESGWNLEVDLAPIEIAKRLKNVFNKFYSDYPNEYSPDDFIIEYADDDMADLEKQDAMSKYSSNEENSLEDRLSALIDAGVYQIILTGAPGTGKTYTALNIAKQAGGMVGFTQFHPSYDYSDFIEGLRPIEKEGKMVFVKIDGVFKKFCREVVKANETDNKKINFFIIDEVNRAELSKVFGELMFGLEKDKRGEKNKFSTQYQNLPTYDGHGKLVEDDVFKEGFYIPENIVLLATMNNIDRSVESMDFALRRRFVFEDVLVTRSLLRSAFNAIFDNDGSSDEKETLIDKLIDRISDLNDVISSCGKKYMLNEDYHIAHGYFTNLPDDILTLDEILAWVYKYRLSSLIYEYVRGEEAEDFLNKCRSTFLGEIERSTDSEDETKDGENDDEHTSN